VRILLFPASYPPVLGGLQTVVSELAEGLIRRGHQVVVATNRYPRSLPAFEVMAGVPVHRYLLMAPKAEYLRSGRPDLFAASLGYFPAVRHRLRRLVRRFEPEVVNIHFPTCQIPFVSALDCASVSRFVVSIHGEDVLSYSESLEGTESGETGTLPRGLSEVLRSADSVTACSEWLLRRTEALMRSPLRTGFVIRNGVELDRFRAKDRHHHPRPYLLAYGRLTPKKGFDLLLDAYANVKDELPDLDLIIAGEGQSLASLGDQGCQLGIEARVQFFGRATPAEVVGLLNGCSCLVIPSRVEPFGIVALEGLAAGVPIVGTRVGGMAEILEQALAEEGTLPIEIVSPERASLADGIRLALGQSAGNARAPAGILDHFQSSAIVDQYLGVFAEPSGAS